MKRRQVVYSETAERDLVTILYWLAETATPLSAIGIVEDIEDYIDTLEEGAERGTSREDIRAGLRTIPHGRAVIAVEVTDKIVTILRIFYSGQDWEAALRRG